MIWYNKSWFQIISFMIWYNNFWFQIMSFMIWYQWFHGLISVNSWFDISDFMIWYQWFHGLMSVISWFDISDFMVWYQRFHGLISVISWFNISDFMVWYQWFHDLSKLWLNLIHNRCRHVTKYDLYLRRGKLSTMSDDISRSIASVVSQEFPWAVVVQPPSPQRTPLRLLKRYVNVLAACRRSCCISLETHLVLIVNKLGGFFFCVLCIGVGGGERCVYLSSIPFSYNNENWKLKLISVHLDWFHLKPNVKKKNQNWNKHFWSFNGRKIAVERLFF